MPLCSKGTRDLQFSSVKLYYRQNLEHKAERYRDLSFFFFLFFKKVVKHQGCQCQMIRTPRLGGLVDTEDFGGGNEVSGLKIPPGTLVCGSSSQRSA